MVDSVSLLSGASPGATTQRAAADGAQLDEDLQYFLNLLVTQLQNQDPLDPLDTNEFTAQLVQFASVEQQIQQNANLESLITLQEHAGTAAMVSYLGTRIEANGNALPLTHGRAEASYTLGDDAAKTTIAVRDAANRVVFTTPGETGPGRHAFLWNGTDQDGNPVPDGTYTLDVTAIRQDESFADVAVTVIGDVTAARVDQGQVRLFMGDTAVAMDDVRSVYGPAAVPRSED